MPGKRKRSKVNYNESKLAGAFDINGKSSKSTKRSSSSSSSSSSKTPTAILEVRQSGKQAYRPGEANKKGPSVEVLQSDAMPVPKRNSKNELVFKDHPEFKPNLTPFEVLERGSFGGTYYRPITSAVTGISYKSKDVLSEYPKEWFNGIDKKTMVTNSKYDKAVNKYAVKCGGSLDMWESSGWIADSDPYGWFQWYCRFYLGRRSTDDARQIKRQMGVCGIKGRFRNQLIGKCARGGKTFDDITISPVIRQALQHWGYVLTRYDADKYVKLKKLPKLRD
tara:strand:- start:272 stop:1108 length:837 start_codon:yes stop_codon:yes gene_type:complete